MSVLRREVEEEKSLVQEMRTKMHECELELRRIKQKLLDAEKTAEEDHERFRFLFLCSLFSSFSLLLTLHSSLFLFSSLLFLFSSLN